MLGLKLLLWVATTAQLGNFPTIPGSSPAGPSSSSREAERDFGWQEDPDGALVYIIQISPSEAQLMQQNNKEMFSDMPPELVGRVTRIAVSIGDEILPRSPSLQEIKRRFPLHATRDEVTAQLGEGRFSDLEREPVVNVQQQPQFTLPPQDPLNNLRSNAGDALAQARERAQQAGGNLIDEVSELANSAFPNAPPLSGSNAGNQFLDGARNGNTPGGLNPPASNRPSTLGREPSIPGTGSSRFQDTAGAPSSSFPPAGTPGTNGPTSPLLADATNSLGTGLQRRQGSTYNLDTPPSLGGTSFPNAPTPNFGSAPGAGNRNANNYARDARGTSPSGSPTTGNYGNRDLVGIPGNNQNPSYGGAGYGNAGYGNAGYGGAGYGGGNYDPQAGGVGNRRGLGGPGNAGFVGQGNAGFAGQGTNSPLPTANGTGANPAGTGQGQPLAPANQTATRLASNDLPGTSNDRLSDPTQSASDRGLTTGDETTRVSRSKEAWLQVFFLVSLIVNFYLGILLRKLLTRYRSLLSNVRSQVA